MSRSLGAPALGAQLLSGKAASPRPSARKGLPARTRSLYRCGLTRSMARLRAWEFFPIFHALSLPFSNREKKREEPPLIDPTFVCRRQLILGEMMSAQKIRAALGLLQDDPDNEASYNDLVEAVTSPDAGMSPGRASRPARIGAARARDAARVGRRRALARARDRAAARAPRSSSPCSSSWRAVFEDELFDDKRAMSATSVC